MLASDEKFSSLSVLTGQTEMEEKQWKKKGDKNQKGIQERRRRRRRRRRRH
jgi:hypothetical protein